MMFICKGIIPYRTQTRTLKEVKGEIENASRKHYEKLTQVFSIKFCYLVIPTLNYNRSDLFVTPQVCFIKT